MLLHLPTLHATSDVQDKYEYTPTNDVKDNPSTTEAGRERPGTQGLDLGQLTFDTDHRSCLHGTRWPPTARRATLARCRCGPSEASLRLRVKLVCSLRRAGRIPGRHGALMIGVRKGSSAKLQLSLGYERALRNQVWSRLWERPFVNRKFGVGGSLRSPLRLAVRQNDAQRYFASYWPNMRAMEVRPDVQGNG